MPEEGQQRDGASQAAQSSASSDQRKTQQSTGAEVADADFSKWSWGAFMFDAPFLIAIQKYVYLLAYLLMLIPFLNFIVWLGLKIYLGLKGRELAEDSSTFDSEAEREGFFKGFDWAGKVLFFVALAFFVLGLLVSVVFGVSAMNAMPGPGGGFSG